MNRALLAGLALVVAIAACDNSFTKGSLVDRTRVIGVRIEAKNDPARSSIVPGESMRATWLVAAPNGTPRLGWSYALCASPTGNFPDIRCEGATLRAASGAADSESIVMEMDVPAGDVRDLLLLAAFCENGSTPALDAQRFEANCGSAEPPLLASAHVTADPANRNPEILDDVVFFDGAPLGPTTLRPNAPCSTIEASQPSVTAGSKHAFGFRLRAEDREAGEALIVSHVTTKGELDRQYSALEVNEAPKSAEIPWNAPGGDPGEGGTVAEFYFVLRDGRGGAALARRAICVRR